ncbi:sodium:solute symporter family protein [Aeoliella sp. ICT_H6.2]|uniref:Sodium:solute symporter family protein n=1 Tax=Aeoliella straminimaris TaxID=2954799 RepID=A0A9X2FC99_9BACT|nr:sodium:solute symporter family protein [Aeoliella straminimaris]MCO6046310.1 sodium:solute symporter family protein [Aeoliella straminimaris]
MTQLVIIAIYLCIVLSLGLFASRMFRGTSSDYMLASHSIGPFLLLMSLFGTTMTAFALVGSTGEAFARGIGVYGMLASSSGIIHSLCFFVLGVKLWQFGRKYHYRTQIQFFRDRLESNSIGLVLFPVLVALVIPYLLIGVMASGTVINKVTAGRIDKGQVVDETVTFARGTFPDFLELGESQSGEQTFAAGSAGGVPKQLASLAICGVVLTYVFFGGMRGTAWANALQTCIFMVLGILTFYVLANKLGGQDGFLANLQALGESIPENKATRVDISKLKFTTYLFVPLSVGMFPHLFQHWLTAKSANSFKVPVVLHPVFIMIVWVPCVLLGAWAAGSLVDVPGPVAANPNAVLPFMVNQLRIPALAGLLTAGILAAIMSSLDSQFLCLGTMFTEDMLVHYGGRQRFTDKQVIWSARLFIVAIVSLTYFFSLFEPRQVFTLGVWSFSGFSSLFPLVLAAVYWRGLTKAGAYACVLTAIGTWFYLFRASGYAADETYGVQLPFAPSGYEVMPVTFMILASTVALVVVSLVTRKPSEETLKKFFA